MTSTVDGAARRERSLVRMTGLFGLTGVVLVFVPIMAIASLDEPAFDAHPDDVVAFLRAADVGWFQVAEATFLIGMLAMLWFFVGFTTVLRRVEDEPAWRSTCALLSAVLFVAYGMLDASWEAAANRGQETDRSVVLYAFDIGNLGFANAWVSMAGFAVATGWVLLETRALPSWWGWWLVAAGVGLTAARFVWETTAWLLPYALFWVWVVAVAIRMVRGRFITSPAATESTRR